MSEVDDVTLFEISENFFSYEGEVLVGVPTAYVRIARCNLKCPLFNNHNKVKTEDGYAPLGFDPKDYTKLAAVPLISTGCDSQYAVNPAFSHMWTPMTPEQVIDDILGKIPFHSFKTPMGGSVAVSLTGGEPSLKWKTLHEIFLHEKMKDCHTIIMETNCSVPFKQEFIDHIGEWLERDPKNKWVWSNSPKLSSSGHTRKQTIRPQIAYMQQTLLDKYGRSQVEQYFKFVCDADQADFDEVKEVMSEYHKGGVRPDAPIWIMPMACTKEQQQENMTKIANMSLEQGFNYTIRMQSILWGNAVGT